MPWHTAAMMLNTTYMERLSKTVRETSIMTAQRAKSPKPHLCATLTSNLLAKKLPTTLGRRRDVYTAAAMNVSWIPNCSATRVELKDWAKPPSAHVPTNAMDDAAKSLREFGGSVNLGLSDLMSPGFLCIVSLAKSTRTMNTTTMTATASKYDVEETDV